MNKKIVWAIIVSVILLAGLSWWYYSSSAVKPSEKMSGRICTMDYTPVCGVDGITYGNACMAGSIAIAYTGECTSVPVDNQMPVLGEVGAGVDEMIVDPAGGTFLAGEVPVGLSDEELAAA